MSPLRPVRGTHDIAGEDARRFRHVVETGRRIAALYGYAEMSPPVFEFAEVFARPLGETSDVVTKEMYTLTDRGGDLLALRPEFTAGVARAFVSEGWAQQIPLRVFCAGPVFRYERPQKGRLRQFHQIDVELIGAPEPLADVEVVACAARILRALGLEDAITLELNTLGDPESRGAYRNRLVNYLERYKDELSRDSQGRLERNPLRILDSKDEGDRKILEGAPSLADSLNAESRAFFDAVLSGLEAAGVAYLLNPRLVRGLDYYTHTAFEFTTTRLGAQGTVLAGGRYDGLIETLGGPPTPGIGWAAGVERLAMLAEAPPDAQRPIAVLPVDEAAEHACLALAETLRGEGFPVEQAFRGKIGQRLKRAAKARARHAVLIGPDELAGGLVQLRDLDRGEQRAVPRDALVEALREG